MKESVTSRESIRLKTWHCIPSLTTYPLQPKTVNKLTSYQIFIDAFGNTFLQNSFPFCFLLADGHSVYFYGNCAQWVSNNILSITVNAM